MAGNDHALEKTPEQWEQELEVSAGVLMTTYGWSHPGLQSRFEEIVKRRIQELDAEYNRMVENHNSSLAEQIRDALRWGDLETVTQKGTARLSAPQIDASIRMVEASPSLLSRSPTVLETSSNSKTLLSIPKLNRRVATGASPISTLQAGTGTIQQTLLPARKKMPVDDLN